MGNGNSAAKAEAESRARVAEAKAQAETERARLEQERIQKQYEADAKKQTAAMKIAHERAQKELEQAMERERLAHQERVRIAEAKAKAEAEQKKYEQERLQKQYEADMQKQIEEKRLAHEKQQKELEQEMEKERLAHAERARKLQKQQKDEAIAECNKDLADFDKKIETATNRKEEVNKEYYEKNEEIKVLDEKISQFESYRSKELLNVAIENELDSAKQAFERVENEINAAIEKTALHESSIGQFLALTQGLLHATLSNQDEANKLSSSMNTFGKLVGRTASGDLSIDYYFETKGMKKFVPILAKEDMSNMEDLVCVDEEDGKTKDQETFDEIMELIETGLQEEHERWEEEKKEFEANLDENSKDKFEEQDPGTKLKLKDKNFFKKVCFQPKKWQQEQKSKIKVTKESLNEVSPIMCNFFNEIHVAMKQAQLVLTYSANNDGKLTDDQQKAIEKASKLEKQNEMKQIEAPKESENNENDEKTESKDNSSEKSESKDEKNELELMQTLDESGKQTFEQSMALNKAAIMSINVIDSMYDEFEGSPNKAKALGLAQSIEGTCMEIVRNIGEIRQSLLLANCILKMKPSNLTPKSRELWDAVDSGIIQIFKNALKLSQVTANYFGFFLKFKQSFNYYLAARDESLLVSTEHLQTDIKEFEKLSSNFNKEVAKLGGSAMDCITGCVKNMAGAENFEKNRADREEKLQTYLRKKKVYDSKDLELSAEFSNLLDQRADAQAKASSSKLVMDSLDQQIQHDTKMRDDTHKTLQSLLG